jgi:Flp pilus assembly protein TadG
VNRVGRGRRARSRGVVLVLVALAMLVLLGLAALGIDVGRLAAAASEVQAYADSVATAGATALLLGASPGAAARQATTVGAVNRVDGRPGAQTRLRFGRWDAATATFTPTNVHPSAVEAAATATVRTLLAGIWSQQTVTVERTATAGFVGLGRAVPTLPLAIGDCAFPSLASCFGQSGCLPAVQNAPSAASYTAWTAFRDSPADAGNVAAYLPADCGGRRPAPQLGVGDRISLSTASADPVLRALARCVTPGRSEYLVPTVSCSANFAQGGPVSGFATVVIDRVQTSGAPGLALHAVFRQVPGPPAGCQQCGTGYVALVG